MVEELGAGTVELMRTVKRALDPLGLFNPGKVSTAEMFDGSITYTIVPYSYIQTKNPSDHCSRYYVCDIILSVVRFPFSKFEHSAPCTEELSAWNSGIRQHFPKLNEFSHASLVFKSPGSFLSLQQTL